MDSENPSHLAGHQPRPPAPPELEHKPKHTLMDNKVKLVDHGAVHAEESKTSFLKYLALFVLTVQNTASVVVSRYSRTMPGPKYLVTTALVMGESMKMTVSVLLVFNENSWKIRDTFSLLKVEIFDKYKETAKVSVPSFLYAVQNYLFFIALTHLDAATFQV